MYTHHFSNHIKFLYWIKTDENKLNILKKYDSEVEIYLKSKSFAGIKKDDAKQAFFHYREWISEYFLKISPDSPVEIKVGRMFDEPGKLVTF